MTSAAVATKQSFNRRPWSARGQTTRNSRSMPCPKCHTDNWCEIAMHDPWSGRPVINCNTCGEYAEYDCLQRKAAHAIIAATLACNVSKEDQRDPRAVADRILDVLENAGLIIARASR